MDKIIYKVVYHVNQCKYEYYACINNNDYRWVVISKNEFEENARPSITKYVELIYTYEKVINGIIQ